MRTALFQCSKTYYHMGWPLHQRENDFKQFFSFIDGIVRHEYHKFLSPSHLVQIQICELLLYFHHNYTWNIYSANKSNRLNFRTKV